MSKRLSKEEALNLTDQLILKEMQKTGKSYLEISREIIYNLNEKLKPAKTYNTGVGGIKKPTKPR